MSAPSPTGKWSKYQVEGDQLVRKNEFCPKCGPGVFLAKHADRNSCGRCGHTRIDASTIAEAAE